MRLGGIKKTRTIQSHNQPIALRTLRMLLKIAGVGCHNFVARGHCRLGEFCLFVYILSQVGSNDR